MLCRAKQQTETGRIVNLMSADVNNVMVRRIISSPSFCARKDICQCRNSLAHQNFDEISCSCTQVFFYPMFSQLLIAPCILIAALVLLWFQIK